MKLDEAIKHAEEVADDHDRIKQIKAVTLEECKCAEEHRQLAEWLKDYKRMKEQESCEDVAGVNMIESERKSIMILADTIKGEINRMCVTKNLAEFDTMYGHAKRNLDKLSKMIYDCEFKAEGEGI